jgi:hypothetical protein
MKQDFETAARHSERGGAGVKLLVVAVVLILIANAGYHYIPVAYNGESFKQEMSTAVVQGIALPSSYGKTTDVVRQKIVAAAQTHDVPIDFQLDVKEQNKTITAHVHYVKDVPVLPFGIYDYRYEFDYTAAPNGFLTD